MTDGQSTLWSRLVELLADGDFKSADRLYDAECKEFLSRPKYEAMRLATEESRGMQTQAEIRDLLKRGAFASADDLYDERQCSSWWPRRTYENEKDHARAILLEEDRHRKQQKILALLRKGDIAEADQYYEEHCKDWRPRASYQVDKERVATELRKAEQQMLRVEVQRHLANGDLNTADRVYEEKCKWWARNEYEALRTAALAKALEADRQRRQDEARASAIIDLQSCFSADYIAADALYRERFTSVLERAEYVKIKRDFVRVWLRDNLRVSPDKFPDDEQIAAIAAVDGTVQVTARAGSGKTTTLICRTYFLLRHCRVPPEQILILAFNRKAALDVRRKLLAIICPLTEDTIAEEIRAKQKSIKKPVDREVAAVDSAIRTHGVVMPSVMTFHALAYGLVNPEESLLVDSDEERAFGLSRAFQGVIDNHLRDKQWMPRIRSLMLAHFRNEWERIERGGFDLTDRDALLAHRRSLPRETLGGEYVKSHGEKVIADFLFEHDVPYKYERNHRWGGFNYRPDFTLFRTKKSGVIIEYFGLAGDPDYDEQSKSKREYWTKKPDWDFLEFEPSNITSQGVGAFRAQLRSTLISLGVPCKPLSEDELWAKVNERGRAIDRFTKAVGAFIGRCRKLLVTPEMLGELSVTHAAATEAEEQFIPLARQFYAEYLKALVATNSEDFDGVLQRAIKAVESAHTQVRRGQAVVCDLAQVRFLSVDEFQDFSELFYQLVQAIRRIGEKVHCFCVGDDWQAINGYAGSDLKYFQDFPRYMGPSNRLTITTNYRSDQAVVSAGNAVMAGRGEPARTRSGAMGGSIVIAGMDEFATTVIEHRRHSGDDITPAVLRVAARSVEAGKRVAVLCRTNSIPWFVNWDDAPDYTALLQRFLPKERRQQVSVSTAHKSKGLEWDDVIVIDAVRRSYPLVHPDWVFARVLGVTIDQIEAEERRLFYVAVTRAKSSVFLFTEKKDESPFLTEIKTRTQVGSIDWNSYPPRVIASEFLAVSVTSRPEYRVPNASGGQDAPTYVLRELLGASGFIYRGGGVWEKTVRAEGFDVAKLGNEPWAGSAQGIDITVRDGCDRVLGEWAVDDGVFRRVGK